MSFRRKLRLHYYKLIKFADKYIQGDNSAVNHSKILITKNASGLISLGNYVMCSAEMYSFFDQGVIKVGDCSYIGEGTRIWSLTNIDIGERVLISHNCFICDNLTHSLDANLRHQQYMAKYGFPFPDNIELEGRPVTIEDDVWIAAGVTILRGVTIGSTSVVGAGSVITEDVPPGVVVAGNPAKVIRKLEASTEVRGGVNGLT